MKLWASKEKICNENFGELMDGALEEWIGGSFTMQFETIA